MILSSPGFIITYRAINRRGQWEYGTVASPEKDYAAVLEREGYTKIQIVRVKCSSS